MYVNTVKHGNNEHFYNELTLTAKRFSSMTLFHELN